MDVAIFTNFGNVRDDQFGGMMPILGAWKFSGLTISGTDRFVSDTSADTSAEGNASFTPLGIEWLHFLFDHPEINFAQGVRAEILLPCPRAQFYPPVMHVVCPSDAAGWQSCCAPDARAPCETPQGVNSRSHRLARLPISSANTL